jgi:drug/metabolite transporter (DMT)-like permease
MILPLLANALIALSFTLAKELLNYLTPLMLLALKTFFAGLFFAFLYVFFRRQKSYKISPSLLFSLMASSFIYIFLTNYFAYTSFRYLSSSLATLIYNFNPFIVAFISYFLFKESFPKQKIAGLVVGWVGFIFLIVTGSASDTTCGGYVYGIATAFASAVCAAVGFILMQKILYKKDIPATISSSITLTFTGVSAFGASLMTEMPHAFQGCQNLNMYALSLLILIIGAMLSWSWVNCYLSNLYRATFLSLIGFTMPLFAVLFEWAFFGRSVGWNFYVAIVFIFLGLLLFYRSEGEVPSAGQSCSIL